jgi:hypothetical protein
MSKQEGFTLQNEAQALNVPGFIVQEDGGAMRIAPEGYKGQKQELANNSHTSRLSLAAARHRKASARFNESMITLPHIQFEVSKESRRQMADRPVELIENGNTESTTALRALRAMLVLQGLGSMPEHLDSIHRPATWLPLFTLQSAVSLLDAPEDRHAVIDASWPQMQELADTLQQRKKYDKVTGKNAVKVTQAADGKIVDLLLPTLGSFLGRRTLEVSERLQAEYSAALSSDDGAQYKAISTEINVPGLRPQRLEYLTRSLDELILEA